MKLNRLKRYSERESTVSKGNFLKAWLRSRVKKSWGFYAQSFKEKKNKKKRRKRRRRKKMKIRRRKRSRSRKRRGEGEGARGEGEGKEEKREE